jgi:antitoxin FitA
LIEVAMADILVRRLDEGVKQRLKERALRHGQSLEQEIRNILEAAAVPEPGTPADPDQGVGSMMQARAAKTGFTKNERDRFELGIRQINSKSDMRIPDFDA